MIDAESGPVPSSRFPSRSVPSTEWDGSVSPARPALPHAPAQRRWSAPRRDGEVVADPPLADTPRLIQHEHAVRAQRDEAVRVAGWPLNELRRQARREVAMCARAFAQRHQLSPSGLGPLEDGTIPLIVTGHQPEWIHPGVWFKMIAAHALARRVGGAALNVVVDQDLVKRLTIKVPDGRSPDWSPCTLAFDRGAGEAIHEEWVVHDWDLFRSLAARTREILGSLVADPIMEPYLTEALRVEGRVTLGERHTVARARLERAWGWGVDEVAISAIARTESFRSLLLDLICQAERFRVLHNAALHDHRHRHKIRSRHHPFADLAQSSEGWIETPFWVWSASRPRRRPLLVRRRGDRVELATPESLFEGEGRPGPDRFADLPVSPTASASARETLAQLEQAGIKIRPRAFTTTLFLRWFLADWFLHGIGGAHYDQLGDRIASHWFQAPPPTFGVLSLTQHLKPGQPDPDAIRRQRDWINQRLRDLTHHPESLVGTQDICEPARAQRFDQLIAQKRQWIEAPTATRAQRAERCRALRGIRSELAALLADQRQMWVAQRAEVESQLASLLRRTDREYAIVLHSASQTRALFQRILVESGLD